jgi:hypothetical protein
MAREMVLVPKIKYEQLLKLSDPVEKTEQTGGQSENRDEHLSTPLNSTETSSSEKQIVISSSRDENDNNITQLDKPRLYIDKPLSKMSFGRMKLTGSRNKRKKGVTTKTRGKKLTKLSEMQKGIKLQWINYTI